MTAAPVEPIAPPVPASSGNGSSPHEQGNATKAAAAPAPDAGPQAMFGGFAFATGGKAAASGFQELMQAYQSMARRNTEKLTMSMQALAAVKTPTEFIELQQKLLTEGVAAAVSDGATIGKLTTAAFAAAFEPMRKQMGDLRSGAKRQE